MKWIRLTPKPDFEKLHQQFHTKIDLGIELVESDSEHKCRLVISPFSVKKSKSIVQRGLSFSSAITEPQDVELLCSLN